jgi:hypothetical protein
MKAPTPCMAKNPGEKITCCLKLGHRGPHSWSWMGRLHEAVKRQGAGRVPEEKRVMGKTLARGSDSD